MVPEKKSLGRKEWKIKQRANCTTRESFFSHVRPRREQCRAGRVAAQRHRPKLRVSVLPSTAAAAAPPPPPPALRRPSQDQGKEAGDSHSHPFYRKAKAFLGSPW